MKSIVHRGLISVGIVIILGATSAVTSTNTAQARVTTRLATSIQPVVLFRAAEPQSNLSGTPNITPAIREKIRRGFNTTTNVRLSFDDCASPSTLQNLLNILVSRRVEATFFFTGVCMAQHPNFRQQIISAHQLLGNHSFDHTDYAKLSDTKIRSQLIRGTKPTTKPMLARPPYGDLAFTVRFYNIAASLNMRPCFWTVDTRDWAGYSAARITHRVLIGEIGRNGTPPAKAGGMILMHGTAKHTLQALPGIIQGLRAKHLVLFSLSK